MKAERINQDQIRFTLSESDLQERDLKVSELNYGSEKVKALFDDMMKTAKDQFGVDFSSRPIMIEAVPLGKSTLSITVTKVKGTAEMGALFGANIPDGQEFFRGFSQKDELRSKGVSEGEKKKEVKDWMQDFAHPEDVIYAFSSFDLLMKAVKSAPANLRLKNELYLDEEKHFYYLIVHYTQLTQAARYLVPMLAQFATEWFFGRAPQLLVKEHAKPIFKARAIQKLAENLK